MANPFEMDWTKPEGEELQSIGPKEVSETKDLIPEPKAELLEGGNVRLFGHYHPMAFSPGNSGSALFSQRTGHDGRKEVEMVGVHDWTPGRRVTASTEYLDYLREQLRKWLETTAQIPKASDTTLPSIFFPGDFIQGRNYPTVGDNLPEPDHIVEKKNE